MTEAFLTETVDTDAGVYTIELFYDQNAENPLTNWDHTGMAFLLSGDRGAFHDSMSDADRAGEVLSHWRIHQGFDETQTERRFDKWRAITGSPWILVTGSGNGYDQSHWWYWSVLVDTTEFPDVDTARKAAIETMNVYEKWARGEFVMYDVTDPDGTNIDSLCDIDDDDYALSEARDSVAHDAIGRKIILANMAEEKMIRANLVGAGFVGII